MFQGRFTIIRPLAYVQEKELKRLAAKLDLPVIKSQCVNGERSKRRLVKGMISEVERHNRNVKKNIFRSLTEGTGRALPEPLNICQRLQ